MSSIIGRIHSADPQTLNPNTPAGPVAGEMVTTTNAPVGVVIQRTSEKRVVILSTSLRVRIMATSGGVLTEDLEVTVQDIAGLPLVGALVQLALHCDTAITSVTVGASGLIRGLAVNGSDALLMVETSGVGGSVDLTVVVAGAGDGTMVAALLFPGIGSDNETWTF